MLCEQPRKASLRRKFLTEHLKGFMLRGTSWMQPSDLRVPAASDDGDEEAIIVSMVCNCPKCKAKLAVPIADARKCGQRKETIHKGQGNQERHESDEKTINGSRP